MSNQIEPILRIPATLAMIQNVSTAFRFWHEDEKIAAEHIQLVVMSVLKQLAEITTGSEDRYEQGTVWLDWAENPAYEYKEESMLYLRDNYRIPNDALIIYTHANWSTMVDNPRLIIRTRTMEHPIQFDSNWRITKVGKELLINETKVPLHLDQMGTQT